jgi:hypothetical protein
MNPCGADMEAKTTSHQFYRKLENPIGSQYKIQLSKLGGGGRAVFRIIDQFFWFIGRVLFKIQFLNKNSKSTGLSLRFSV